MITVVISGSRGWTNEDRIHDAFAWLRNQYTHAHIIHGTAQGADRMCARIASDYGFEVTGVPAQWSTYGRRAGHLRNVQMLTDFGAEMVIAFWDGNSPGTRNMIREAKHRGIRTYVVREPVQTDTLF